MKYLITPQSITVILDGQSYMVGANHPNYQHLKVALKDKRWQDVPNYVDIPKTIELASKGIFKVTSDGVFKGAEKIHSVVTDRIMQFVREGKDFKPLFNFLEKVSKNPSRRSIKELYKFLEHKNLPLDSDGDFYAYKAVRNNFLDKHSGTFNNSIGKVVSIERNQVDDDARHACSYGLHVGSLEYVRSFASNYGGLNGDQIVIVKVNPADVVSVPYDCNCQKVRVASYYVAELFKGELPQVTYDYESNDEDWEDEEYNTVICDNCGSVNDEWEDYCYDCGRELSW